MDQHSSTTSNTKCKTGTTLWIFIGCLILFLIFNYQITNKQSSNISALLGAFHPSKTWVLQQPSDPKPEQPSNNITINQTILTAAGANPVTGNNVTEQLETKTTKTTKENIKCNLYEGRWVYDPELSPSYDAKRCPFYDYKLSCQNNGRPDSEYLKWRWEAADCDIPLFNGTDMLERLRNKRVIIVGDSINRNLWESLACLLYSSISDPSRAEVNTGASPKVLKAKDYNFSMEFYMNPFLVERKSPTKIGHRVLVLDKIASASKKWQGADVMVFNSWHWWTHPDKIKAWDMFEYKGQLIEEMSREMAFELAMKTWARWIENNVDSRKTTVFFRGDSATHWGNHFCYNSTQPITDIQSFESRPNPLLEVFDTAVIKGMSKLDINYMNVTKLTQYRSDAHPSIYTSLKWKDGKNHTSDCSHWCLPGVPDTWNRLLYASLFFEI